MTTGKDAIVEVMRQTAKTWPTESVEEFANKEGYALAFVFQEELERRGKESKPNG